MLGAAQFLLPVELSHLLATQVALDADQTAGLVQEVHSFQETLLKFKQLNVDTHEYACLRAIVLFKTCKFSSFKPLKVVSVKKIQITN